MFFNQYIWDLYKESKDGREKIEYYRQFTLEDAADEIHKIHPNFFKEALDEQVFKEEVIDYLEEFIQYFETFQIKNMTEASEVFKKLMTSGIPMSRFSEEGEEVWCFAGKDDLYSIYTYIDILSATLYIAHPDFFTPYFLLRNFAQFQQLADLFNLSLPNLPGRRNEQEKAFYYWELNRGFQEFRSIYQMTPPEMCAFLYDFAVKFLESRSDQTLPEPSKVWMSSSGEFDFERLDNARPDSRYPWSGSRYAKKGDIQIVYCFKPRKYIHSIWRINVDGFIDPFYSRDDMVWISNPVLLDKPIERSELEADQVWSQSSIIRSGTRGLSGRPVSVKEYHALLEMIKKNGQSVKDFPKIEDEDAELPDVQKERDVEEDLVEPLLKKLDFEKKDWVRQLPIRMGRGNTVYPDYALGVNTKKNEESAKMLVEAKYEISGKKDLYEAFCQARSYAWRLRASVFIVAARNGIWVFDSRKKEYDLEKHTYKKWKQLNSKDEISALSRLIGKKAWLRP